MKKLSYIALVAVCALCLTSCEGCVKKMAKKATEISLSAAEGVAEALTEHGEVVTEKATDAVGSMAKGAGRSIDRQLGDDLAPEVTGQMYKQKSAVISDDTKNAYDQIKFVCDEAQDGVSMEFFGTLKAEPFAGAYFMIPNAGAYTVNIFCIGDDDKVSMVMKGDINGTDPDKVTFVVLRFNLDDYNMARLKNAKQVRVTIRKK